MFRVLADNVGVSRFAIVLVVVAGCARVKDGASCGEAAGRFFKLASEDLASATADDTTRRQVRDQLPAMRDALDLACKDGKWARPVRDCIATATDHAAIEGCERSLTDLQKAALDRSARGETPKTP